MLLGTELTLPGPPLCFCRDEMKKKKYLSWIVCSSQGRAARKTRKMEEKCERGIPEKIHLAAP